MFKKTLAAAALLGAFAGSAVAADVTLYGVVDYGLQYTHVDSDKANTDAVDNFQLSSGNQSGARFGLKGSEDLGNGVKAGFHLENGFSADTGSLAQNSRLFGREARLFVNGAFGEVAFGRMGTLGSANGTYGLLGNLSPFGASWVGAVEYSTYYVGGIRADNTVTYKTPTFAGVTVYAQYSFETNTKQEENLKATEGKASANRYYALGATYKAAGFDLAAVVDSYNWSSTFTKKDADLDDGLSVTLGGSYDFEVAKVFLSGQYFDNMIGNDKSQPNSDPVDAGKSDSFYSFSSYFDNQNPIEGYALQAGVSAPVAGGTAMFAVGYTDAEEANSEANQAKIEFKRIGTSVGYTYSLSKRTNLYGVAAYYRDSVKNEGHEAGADRDPSTVTVYAGIRHTF
ncbi:porin [Sutterella wadsworthensis]|uniref:porin n=1 Tax=Sutterella wadsworthensis TaxID=40545 RepID=UPI002431A977|nr:porin [Sutterella wadsworthensis]